MFKPGGSIFSESDKHKPISKPGDLVDRCGRFRTLPDPCTMVDSGMDTLSYDMADYVSGAASVTVGDSEAASAEREYVADERDSCTVSWKTSFGRIEALVFVGLPRTERRDACRQAVDWANAMYKKLPR